MTNVIGIISILGCIGILITAFPDDEFNEEIDE
jgi:hypothetical protein